MIPNELQHHGAAGSAACPEPDERGVTWWLTGRLSDSEPMRQVAIDRSPFRVGRDNALALTIPRTTVSSQHAEFVVTEEALRLCDLGSTNGTFVNGKKVTDECTLHDGDLVQFAEIVFRVGLRTSITESQTMCNDGADRAMALIQFDRLMSERAVLPFVQPIVSLHDRHTVGYEVLARSRFYGLTEPKAMFHAAALLDAESELSRLMRSEGMACGKMLPPECAIFLNTHPNELKEPDVLVMSLRELREAFPAGGIVLEIHEASVTRPSQMRELKAQLADLQIKLAYDDFGAGQARLTELIEVPPDYLKYDLNLIRGIENAWAQQRVVRVLVSMVQSIGVIALAEGIENEAAHEICSEIGFELGQGFLYGKPALAKNYARQGKPGDTDPTSPPRP